jgi:hypothetical protein
MAIDKKLKESEDKLQADCFMWFHNTFTHLRGLLWHCPNELTGLVHPSVSNKMKAMGLVAGVPDLELHFRSRSYFFELKNPSGTGVVSEVQKKIHRALDAQRFVVHVLNDLDSFKHLVSCIVHDQSQQFTHGITKADYFYKHKVFNYLYSLGDCTVINVADITETENIQKFMGFVSEFMVEGYDKLDGFELLFTPDYRGFYKRIDGSTQKIEYKSIELK